MQGHTCKHSKTVATTPYDSRGLPLLKLPEKKNTHQEREKKVKLYGSVSHKRPPLMCGSNVNLYFWPGGFDWWGKPWRQWWCRWWMLWLHYWQWWWALWVIVWDLFCVWCVLRGVNITPFPLRFRSCDIRLTSYSIQNPHSYISSTSTRTKLRGSREKESWASAGHTRGKRAVKLTWARSSLWIKYSLSGWNISHTWKKENFKWHQF